MDLLYWYKKKQFNNQTFDRSIKINECSCCGRKSEGHHQVVFEKGDLKYFCDYDCLIKYKEIWFLKLKIEKLQQDYKNNKKLEKEEEK